MLNIYGTADIGAMAWETPTSILIRRIAMEKKTVFKEVFSAIHKTPTLAQYNPLFISFEESNGEVLLTGNNSIPLVRYAVGDHGGVFGYDEVSNIMKNHKIDLFSRAKRASLPYLSKLPFVYVYERTDFAVKLHLRDIYPEIIRDVVINKRFSSVLTGKFTLATKYDKDHNQYLELNFELANGSKIRPAEKKELNKKILEALHRKTTGPGNPNEFIRRPGLIKTVFWPTGDARYFRPGIKQKWVQKTA